jgi:hypothetical protein
MEVKSKKAIYSKTIDAKEEKTNIEFISLSKAWDKLMKLYKDGKLIHDGAAYTWMRLKHPTKNITIQMDSSWRLINSFKENETFIYNISITFYKY